MSTLVEVVRMEANLTAVCTCTVLNYCDKHGYQFKEAPDHIEVPEILYPILGLLPSGEMTEISIAKNFLDAINEVQRLRKEERHTFLRVWIGSPVLDA